MIRYRTNDPSRNATPRCLRALEERMADDIREMAFAGQNVSAETLVVRGYSADVVKRLGPKAVALARRQATRQIADVHHDGQVA